MQSLGGVDADPLENGFPLAMRRSIRFCLAFSLLCRFTFVFEKSPAAFSILDSTAVVFEPFIFWEVDELSGIWISACISTSVTVCT